MDELSWRARLAKKNINILNIDDEHWYYEFMYHPYNGSTKWCKTFLLVKPEDAPEVVAQRLEAAVLSLRRELER